MRDTENPHGDEAALRRAKRPATVLAGPYGHPFHALVVTVPIGAWVASLVFDIVGAATGDGAFAVGARWLIGVGVAGAIVAAVLGLLDLSRLTPGSRVRRIALWHMAINSAVLVLYVLNLALRLGDTRIEVAPVVLSVLALALLGVSGYLGGELAYRYGVRVADETTQRAGYEP